MACLLYPPGKSPWYPLNRGQGVPQNQYGCLKKKNLLFLPGNEPWLLRHAAHRLVTTTELSLHPLTIMLTHSFFFLTVHRDKFLIIKPTRCTDFSNLFLEWNSTCFGQFLCPSSGVFHCTHSNGICHTGLLRACEQEHMLLLASWQQTCMPYTTAVCTVKNSWWWTEELSESCRFSFQE